MKIDKEEVKHGVKDKDGGNGCPKSWDNDLNDIMDNFCNETREGR